MIPVNKLVLRTYDQACQHEACFHGRISRLVDKKVSQSPAHHEDSCQTKHHQMTVINASCSLKNKSFDK